MQFPPTYEGDGKYVFVSYAHEDAQSVYAEIEWLQNEGINVWYDTGIHAGSDWSEELAARIIGCYRFLMFITPRYAVSENCRRELNFALAEQRPLLAAHLEQTELPPGLRLSLENRQAILKQRVGADAYREALIDSLRQSEKAARDRPVPPPRVSSGVERQPLVGRREPLERLLSALDSASGGQARVSFLAGEPGIGKTRTAEEVVDVAKAEGASVYIGRCEESVSAPPYWPWVRLLRAIVSDQQGSDWRKAVEPDAGVLSTIVPELQQAFTEMPEAPELEPNRLLLELSEAVASVLKRLANERPLLLWLDDVHRADEQSLQVLAALARLLEDDRVFMLATYRAADVDRGSPLAALLADLARLNHFDRLELKGLSHQSVKAVLEQYADDVDAQLVDLVAAKTDGNPLYVTLLARALAEHEDLGSGTEFSLPDSVREVVLGAMAKLSADANTVVEIASVMGREFDPQVVELVSGLDAHAVDQAIEELHKVGVLSLTHEGVVRFDHVLIRDAVYGDLARGRRRSLHGAVADALSSAVLAHPVQPEFLAHHLTEAGEIARAIPLWQTSGERAAQRAAPGDAAGFFKTALDLLAKLPENETRHAQELALQGLYGLSLSASAGYALPEVELAQRRALVLCELLGDGEARYAVLRRLCTFYIVRNELDQARELADECIAAGEAQDRVDWLIEGYNALGYVQTFSGELVAARQSLERSLALYETEHGDGFVYPTEQNPAVAANAELGLVLAICGEFGRAKACAESAVAVAERLERPFDLAYAQVYYSVIAHLLGDIEEAERRGRLCAELSSEHGFALWQCLGTFCQIQHAAEPPDAASVETMQQMLAFYEGAGAHTFVTYYLACLADRYMSLERYDDARRTIEAAFATVSKSNERFYEPALYRLRGQLCAAENEAADADFLRAKEVAAAQGAKLFELEALMSLCNEDRSYEQELRRLCEDFAARGESAPMLEAAAAILAESK